MDLLAKKELLNELFIHYQNLFSEKQKEYFKLYYFDDYSLTEISEIYSVSRNAIYDGLKNIEISLIDYEKKLRLHENRLKRLEILNDYEKKNDKKYLDLLRKMDE